MPHGDTYGNLPLPGGFAHLSRFGPSESALAQFLYPQAWRDVTFVEDDFTGAALNTHLWTVSGINGTNFDPPATQLLNGVCQGVTSGTATDWVALRGDDIWAGDNNCGMEICFKIDNVTLLQFETGFMDPLTNETAASNSAINDIDTPTITNGAADVALVGMDTGQTLTTMAFITDGSTANMNTTKTNLGTRTPTNATYMIVRVQLAGNAASCIVMDNNGAVLETAQHGAALANQTEGGTLIHPRFFIEPVTTPAARTVDIDYWAVWQDRAARS